MSSSRQFRDLQSAPLQRKDRQRGGILVAMLQAERDRDQPAVYPGSAHEESDMMEEEEEEEGDEEEQHVTPAQATGRKRKFQTRKKRSLGHYLARGNKCVLCDFTQDGMFRPDSMIRHWGKVHSTQYEAVEAASNDGKDVSAAVATLVDSVRNSSGSMMRFVMKKNRVQEGRWLKELGAIRFIICKKIPFQALDSKEWTDMLCDFGVSLDSKSVILDLIEALFEFTLEIKKERLQRCAALSVAADFWTSKANRKYLALVYFGITDEWKLVTEVMDLIRFPGTTIAELCHAVMETRVNRHAGEDQLIAQYTTDNGADLKRTRDLLETDHDDCMNHVCNSAFGDVMVMDILMTADFQTMQYVISTIESEKNLKLCFQELQRQADDDLTAALEFVHHNKTRWLSAISFWERFVRFEATFCNEEAEYHTEVFSHVMENFPANLSTDILTPDFFLRVKGYIEVAKAYKIAQLVLQSTTRPTGSLVVPTIGGLIRHCTEFQSSVKGVEEFSRAMARTLQDRGGRYLSNVSNYLLASLLDPSQHHSVSEYVSDDVIERAWSDIQIEISAQITHSLNVDEEVARTGAEFQLKLLQSALGNSKVSPTSKDPLDFYRLLPNKDSMGAALTVVRQLLAIPAGESHCERCFSWADGFVTKLRNRTGNQSLEMQLIIYDEFSRPDFQWETFRQKFIGHLVEKWAETNGAPQAAKK